MLCPPTPIILRPPRAKQPWRRPDGPRYRGRMTDWTSFDQALAARRRRIVEDFVEFLSVDTVSQQTERVRRGAQWLRAAKRAPGLGAPLPDGWLQPSPFTPALRRGAAEAGAPIVELGAVPDEALADHRLYARGAADDKGPIWAHLQAL